MTMRASTIFSVIIALIPVTLATALGKRQETPPPPVEQHDRPNHVDMWGLPGTLDIEERQESSDALIRQREGRWRRDGGPPTRKMQIGRRTLLSRMHPDGRMEIYAVLETNDRRLITSGTLTITTLPRLDAPYALARPADARGLPPGLHGDADDTVLIPGTTDEALQEYRGQLLKDGYKEVVKNSTGNIARFTRECTNVDLTAAAVGPSGYPWTLVTWHKSHRSCS